MSEIELDVGMDFRHADDIHRYNIGWELRASRSVPKLEGSKLTVDRTGVRIEHKYPLARR